MGHLIPSHQPEVSHCSSGHLGRSKQPWECCCVFRIMLETGRSLQNFLKFSPTSGELIWECTLQQVSYTSFFAFFTFTGSEDLFGLFLSCPHFQDSLTCNWRGQQFLWMKWSLLGSWTAGLPGCLLTSARSVLMARLLYHFFLRNWKGYPLPFHFSCLWLTAQKTWWLMQLLLINIFCLGDCSKLATFRFWYTSSVLICGY